MTLGRPVEFDRDQAVQRALHLFWRNGFRGTSLSDLCGDMDLSKSSFYAAFGDKRQLFLTCIQAYSDRLLAEFEFQRREAGSPRAFLESILFGLADEADSGKERRGCLVMNTATEFAQTDRDVAKIVERTIARMRFVIEEVIKEGRARGEINAGLEPSASALFMVSTIAGMKTMVKAGAKKRELMNVAKLYLDQL